MSRLYPTGRDEIEEAVASLFRLLVTDLEITSFSVERTELEPVDSRYPDLQISVRIDSMSHSALKRVLTWASVQTGASLSVSLSGLLVTLRMKRES